MRHLRMVFTFIFFALIVRSVSGQAMPPSVTAAIIVKILSFEQNLQKTPELDLYVIGSPEVGSELKKIVGRQIGSFKIKSVETGDKLPSSKPDAIFVDDASMAKSVVQYANANKILTITRNKDVQKHGITILLELIDGKPQINISPTASNAEGLEWNPAIFKIAKKIE